MKQILDLFRIPRGCQMEKNIPLGTFLANMDGTPKDKLDFKNSITHLTIRAQINPEDVNLSSFITDEEHYQAILFLEVNVKSLKDLVWIDEKIHASIPQPTFIFFTKGNNLRISAPTKRINKVYRSKAVVESYWLTSPSTNEDFIEFVQEWFEEKAAYLNHLKAVYTYIQNIIQVFQYRTHLGKTKDNINALAILTNQLYELEKNEINIRLEYERANMKMEKLIFHKKIIEIQNTKSLIISKFKGE
jgi:viroplasmin and RNaseH domain-containing protein